MAEGVQSNPKKATAYVNRKQAEFEALKHPLPEGGHQQQLPQRSGNVLDTGSIGTNPGKTSGPGRKVARQSQAAIRHAGFDRGDDPESHYEDSNASPGIAPVKLEHHTNVKMEPGVDDGFQEAFEEVAPADLMSSMGHQPAQQISANMSPKWPYIPGDSFPTTSSGLPSVVSEAPGGNGQQQGFAFTAPQNRRQVQHAPRTAQSHDQEHAAGQPNQPPRENMRPPNSGLGIHQQNHPGAHAQTLKQAGRRQLPANALAAYTQGVQNAHAPQRGPVSAAAPQASGANKTSVAIPRGLGTLPAAAVRPLVYSDPQALQDQRQQLVQQPQQVRQMQQQVMPAQQHIGPGQVQASQFQQGVVVVDDDLPSEGEGYGEEEEEEGEEGEYEDEPKDEENLLDYAATELFGMSYNQLRQADFDDDPNARPFQLPDEHNSKPIPEKLQYVRRLDIHLQHDFFQSLSIADWELCGDWFLKRFGAAIDDLRAVRREKREAAHKFEKEVEDRHDSVSLKRKHVDDALSEMKTSGNLVLTPKKKQNVAKK